jgi:hypothetical protein
MTRNRFLITVLVGYLMMLQAAISYAEEITIGDIQVTTINSPDSSNQVLLLLQFQFPAEIDSTTIINFAELSAQVSYQLYEGFPMVLGCAALLRGAELSGLPFDSLRVNLGQYSEPLFLATAPFGDSSRNTALFDITQIAKQWVQDRSTFNGLLILPFDNQSSFYGILAEDPTVTLKISYQEQSEE